jgi:hypothetical protein
MGKNAHTYDPAAGSPRGAMGAVVGDGTYNPYFGVPKYDSRFAVRYARDILASGKYYQELDNDFRSDGMGFRADSLSMVFARALDYIIRKPYEAEYPELRAPEFLPLMTEVPPEALTFTYRMIDKIGQAQIIQENGSDAPKVDIKGEEWQAPIVTIGMSYDYTILDTLRAARMNVPLEAYKAEAARFGCEYLMEVIAAVGALNSGVAGFTNAPGVQATAQVSVASGNWIKQIASIGTASTSNATPPAVVVTQAIAGDVNAAISQVFTATQGIHRPDTMLVDVAAYAALMTAPRSPGFTDDTILDYLEKNCQIDIECWPQLNSAGAVTTTYNGVSYSGRVMLYKKDPKLLNLVVCQPWTQLPPQPIRMAWEVTSYLRTGGVTIRYPNSVTYLDGTS